MGGIFSRWRKKASVNDVLEELDQNIAKLEKTKEGNLHRQRKLVGSLILYSVLIYAAAALLFYLYYTPEQWTDRLMYSVPLLLFPFLVYLVKRALHWYFVKRINRYEEQLEVLKEKKNVILEEVMENETFKVAKEILEKYDPEKLHGVQVLETPSKTDRKTETGSNDMVSPVASSASLTMQQQTPKSHNTPQHSRQQQHNAATAMQQSQPPSQHALPHGTSSMAQQAAPGPMRLPPQPPPMPRPILPRERGLVDRLMDYLVGDGPQNRYALVCSQCLSHNGMALKEEFEFVGFRCCYCYTVNPAKKQREHAPQIPKTRGSDFNSNIPNPGGNGTAVTGGMAGPGVSAGSYSSLGAGARLRRQYGGAGGGGGSGGSVENSSDDDYSRRGPMETDKDK